MAKTTGVDIRKLARIGAAARLAELEREIAALKRAFPGLKVLSVDVVEAREPVSGAEAARAARKAASRGRRKPMTAAERRAVSERMKKYWAGRRRDKGES